MSPVRPSDTASASGQREAPRNFDQPVTERRNGFAERLIALSANALVILASARLGEERVPHSDFLCVTQRLTQTRIDDCEQTRQRIVAALPLARAQ